MSTTTVTPVLPTTPDPHEAALLATIPTGLFIDGAWRASRSGRTFAVTDPATGAELARVADATPEEGLEALDAADRAAAAWAATAPRKRAEILRRAFDLVIERRDDFALVMTMEMGKSLAEAQGEVTYGAEFLRWFSEESVRISGRYGQNPEGTGTMIVSHRPVGPCLLITPWNFPLAMGTRKVAPALAAGCTVVLKPADATPLTSLLLTQVLIEAGVPAGVVNVVTTSDSPALSAPIIADRRLRKMSFTGSTRVGRILGAQAADNVLRTSMELGGNAPFLVFEDADLDAAVDGAMLAKFRNIGQACTAANRFIVHESVADAFAEKLAAKVSAQRIGRGTEDGVAVGPLINDGAVDHSVQLVEDAVSRGATIVTGGAALPGAGSFFEPTVLNGVAPDSRLLTEEIFGPVAGITRFRDEAEAVRLANSTEYGLVSYAYTRDVGRAHRLIPALRSGMLGINVGVISDAAAPFGGVGWSGLGREGGTEGILEYLDTSYALIPAETA
jgi:succinate-semialdehyde dehydrogenase / glutarate-semialdehyde dehydrogenase